MWPSDSCIQLNLRRSDRSTKVISKRKQDEAFFNITSITGKISHGVKLVFR